MTTLTDQEIRLRELEPNDRVRLAELANNYQVSKNLRDAFPHPYTLQDAEDFISKQLNKSPTTLFAIEYKGDHVGNIALVPCTDVYRKSAEIGYFIGEDYWQKGIASAAVKLITNYGFEQLQLCRIHTGVFEFNHASMRVLEKCGYKKEGIFKKAIFKENKLWDEHRFAILNPKSCL